MLYLINHKIHIQKNFIIHVKMKISLLVHSVQLQHQTIEQFKISK